MNPKHGNGTGLFISLLSRLRCYVDSVSGLGDVQTLRLIPSQPEMREETMR